MCCARPEGGKGHGPQAYRDCLTDCYSLSDNTVRLRKTCVLRRRALCTVCAPTAVRSCSQARHGVFQRRHQAWAPAAMAVPARGQTPGQTLGKPWANPLHFGANPTPDGQARAQQCCPAWQRQVRVIPTNLPLYKSKRPDATKPSLLRSPASLRALPQSCCHCSLDFYSPSLLRSPASLR